MNLKPRQKLTILLRALNRIKAGDHCITLCNALDFCDNGLRFQDFGIRPKRQDRCYGEHNVLWYKLDMRGRTSRLNVLYKALVKMCPGTCEYDWRVWQSVTAEKAFKQLAYDTCNKG